MCCNPLNGLPFAHFCFTDSVITVVTKIFGLGTKKLFLSQMNLIVSKLITKLFFYYNHFLYFSVIWGILLYRQLYSQFRHSDRNAWKMHFYYFFVIVSNKTIFLIPPDLSLNFQKSLGEESGPGLCLLLIWIFGKTQ